MDTLLPISTKARVTILQAASAVATPAKYYKDIERIFDELEAFVRSHCTTSDAVAAMVAAFNQQLQNRPGGSKPYGCNVEEFTTPVLGMFNRLFR